MKSNNEAATVSGISIIFTLALMLSLPPGVAAQDRESGPWWPSPHGPSDQAGGSNYVTPEKILQALTLPKTGRTYELGHPYEASMPQYGDRPYYLSVPPAPTITKPGVAVTHRDYLTGFIGQMGTQFDALSHQGLTVQMADGTVQPVFYNGYTEEELTGQNGGLGGTEALGVEHFKPFITRGILVDIAGYKGIETLGATYAVTLADVIGALERQGMDEDTIEQGDAVLFNYGWSANWTNSSKYNDRNVGVGENEGSPGINADVGRWLAERNVSMVGADSCCVQVSPRPGPDRVHHILFFEKGIPLLENMELREVARDQVYEFLFLNLTLRINGATGSPVRPIAVQ